MYRSINFIEKLCSNCMLRPTIKEPERCKILRDNVITAINNLDNKNLPKEIKILESDHLTCDLFHEGIPF
jgi:hypothetical protein